MLQYVNRFVNAILNIYNTTIPVKLKDEQEIFNIISGKGSITTGRKTADLYSGIAVLMPAGYDVLS